MKLRRVASLTLMLSLLALLITSIVLYLVPHGRVAYWADWRFLGLSKTQWGNLHTNLGFLGLIAGLIHLWFNWGPVKTYLKNKAREMLVFTPAFLMALGLSVVITAGTLLEVPPLVWIQDLSEYAKDLGTETYGEPPYGHAEESSLRAFLVNTRQDRNVAKANLEAAGIFVIDPEIIIAELAQQAGVTPRELHAIMLGPEEEQSTTAVPFPEAVPRGTGRRTVAEFSAEYNRDPVDVLAALADAGITAEADQILKDVAEANGIETLDILEALRAHLD